MQKAFGRDTNLFPQSLKLSFAKTGTTRSLVAVAADPGARRPTFARPDRPVSAWRAFARMSCWS
jgi:hypothetical protein